jgi:molecular chaperone GrpE
MSDDKKPVQEPSANETAAGQPDAGAATPPPVEGLESLIGPEQLRAMITALQTELDKKTEEAGQKHDSYLRAVAETENVRRRMEKEKDETARYAITKFAKDILSVGDNFQRAIAAVPQDAVAADPALKTLVDGVMLAERDFRSALERHGVKAIDPAGQPFNPHQHQAVMEKEDASVPAGTVLQVFQTGYLIEDRCLRPAMVVVSRGGPRAGTKPAENNGEAPQQG